MTYYITATKKGGGRESEITHYKYVTDASRVSIVKSKEDLWNLVKGTFKADRFYSYNTQLNTKVICEWRQIGDGQPFLQSDPNGTKKDNLLELPDC